MEIFTLKKKDFLNNEDFCLYKTPTSILRQLFIGGLGVLKQSSIVGQKQNFKNRYIQKC
jgi:hypothetical protein